ncbi:MAG: DNA-protecting protein DprA [Bacteroidetes bacterium]|nr:MAG: DNA-protecting protein DprA [Bacteroidota bacterium]
MAVPFDIRDLLHLASIPKVGNHRLRSLIAHFRHPRAVMAASARELCGAEHIDRKIALAVAHAKPDQRFIDDQLSRLNRVNGRIVTLWDEEYPSLLKRIYDPPVLLFVRGRFRPQDHYALGVVGTRHPSAYGRTVTERFTAELVRLGVTAVSGLARGIDTAAHASALSAGGRTVAVIGSALDAVYPPENRKLCDRIEEQGAVVSEFFMGTKLDPGNFPRRNRIISGMSHGLLIVESDFNGGAMITASTALDQNRELFAVPGNLGEKTSNGTNTLIKRGQAKLVQSVDDILDELRSAFRPLLSESRRPLSPPPPLTLFEERVYSVLSAEPMHVDGISEASGMPPADTLVHLLTLEFKGAVKQMAGKMFLRV